MKKIISIFLIIAVLSGVICAVVSCGNNDETPTEPTSFGTHTTSYVRGQYIWWPQDYRVNGETFKSFEEMLGFIKRNDATELIPEILDPEEEKLAEWHVSQYDAHKMAYENMLKQFHDDGYIIYPSHETAEMKQNSFYVRPIARSEDAGNYYYFYNDSSSATVAVYYTYDEVKYPEGDIGNKNDAYFMYRFGSTSYYLTLEKINIVVDGQVRTAYVRFADTDPNDDITTSAITFFIDDTHYISVMNNRNPMEREKFIEFVEGLSFDIIWFE